mgnify:CR=1 FL=1
MQSISLVGVASGESKVLKYQIQNLEMSMLAFLQLNNIPIASSCGGKRVCETCTINGNILSCAITLEEFISNHGKVIEVDYL